MHACTPASQGTPVRGEAHRDVGVVDEGIHEVQRTLADAAVGVLHALHDHGTVPLHGAEDSGRRPQKCVECHIPAPRHLLDLTAEQCREQ